MPPESEIDPVPDPPAANVNTELSSEANLEAEPAPAPDDEPA